YTRLGGKIPKGALLIGPPGTGKTLLAKAVAGEADVPFFSISGSDFVEMFVGVGASRVRDLFRQAKEKAPCIVFIDEIDAVGRARGKNVNFGANDERENTLNQLLTEMDGFSSNSGVIILAATNRADVLDKALLRAGRFDRQIYVELPDLNDRREIFNVHLRPIKIDETVDVDFLARQTPGFSGADIANVCNEAALIAARRKKKFVQKEDFLSAVDRIVGGLEKKSKIITQDEKRSIAIHESGHATLSWFLRYASPLVKVTIVPRGKALGAAWYLPEERQITTKEQMLDEMCALLGGRAAEELFTGTISSGAMNDLERITKQAYAMIMYMGMSEKLANLCYYDSTGQEYSFSKPYSEETAKLIDSEVKAMISEQYERAKAILLEHKEGHGKLAEILLEKEIIYAEDLEAIFGKRQWISRSQEILEISKNMRPDDNIIRSKPQEVNPFADVNLNSASTPRFSKEGEETKVEKFSENEKDIDISEKEE
ncbi:MAG: ATP-dependent zinc metalloprotease FtsH, partial [Dysgonamonadaceae bacterium]